MITNDNEILVGISDDADNPQNRNISTLILEENLESVRINLPLETYDSNRNIHISNDLNYICIPLDNKLEVWSV
jgi:hypothetical protein